jgi:hypothetical protein
MSVRLTFVDDEAGCSGSASSDEERSLDVGSDGNVQDVINDVSDDSGSEGCGHTSQRALYLLQQYGLPAQDAVVQGVSVEKLGVVKRVKRSDGGVQAAGARKKKKLGWQPDLSNETVHHGEYASEAAWCEALGKELSDRDSSGDCLFVSILESVAHFVELPPVVALLRRSVVAQFKKAARYAATAKKVDVYPCAGMSYGGVDIGVAAFARMREHGNHSCLVAACDVLGCCAVVWEIGRPCQAVFRRRGAPLLRLARHVPCGAVALLSSICSAPHATWPAVLWLRCHLVGLVVALW